MVSVKVQALLPPTGSRGLQFIAFIEEDVCIAFQYLDFPFFILVDGVRLTGLNSKYWVFHPVVLM